MAWHKKKKIHGKNRYYSLSNILRKENKSHDEFEVMLNNLTLEEIIGLKLELAAKSAGGYLYGIPIFSAIPYLVKDAILKYSLSATRSKKEAARFLGINLDHFKKLLKKYNTEYYFKDLDNN
tara:strand:+ start:2704 stop:3069 length:366 start_codon:yes stop_codon:yes gene_type:complete